MTPIIIESVPITFEKERISLKKMMLRTDTNIILIDTNGKTVDICLDFRAKNKNIVPIRYESTPKINQ